MRRRILGLVALLGLLGALGVAPPAGATVPGRNGLIAFHGETFEILSAIMTVRPNGQQMTTLIESGRDPSWSPDGERIAFVSDGSEEDISVMNADGTGVSQLTSTGLDSQPNWSPDGSQIAFVSSRDGNREIYVMGADGSNPTNLTNDPAEDYDPAWSPDGSQIIFTSNRGVDTAFDLYLMDPSGAGVFRLTHGTPEGGGGDMEASWSPDGSQIAFSACDESCGQLFIYVMNADGSGMTALTRTSGKVLGGEDTFPAWSPDGKTIAYTACCPGLGAEAVWTIRPDGTHQLSLTGTEVTASQPDWQPLPKGPKP